jgi:hypothetical protein
MLELLGGDKKTADTNQTQQSSEGTNQQMTLNENSSYPNNFSPLSYLPQQSIQPPEQPQQKTEQPSSKKKSSKRKTSMLNLPPLEEVVKQMQQPQQILPQQTQPQILTQQKQPQQKQIKYLLTPEQIQKINEKEKDREKMEAMKRALERRLKYSGLAE